MSAVEAIAALIHREGSITFDVFMEYALYEPHVGFFATGRGAGRSGRDFLTSPEVGPLFGTCVARAIDRAWHARGDPDPFLFVEAGAGNGRLAREVLRGEPACLPALRYVLVERSEHLRAAQRELLPIEPADEALGPFVARGDDEELTPVAGAGPVFASLPELPEMPVEVFVFANELLDNLPFGIAEWNGSRWNEVRVTLDDDGFVEIPVPAVDADAAALDAVVAARGSASLPAGTRLPIARGIDNWMRECGRALHSGVVTLVDYVIGLDDLVARGGGWLRSYRTQRRTERALDDPGAQDITADVLREQLVRSAHLAGFAVVDERSQATWLHDLGIEDLLDAGARAWESGAARGDLDAIAGRSRGSEAAALVDLDGLGAHRVVMLVKPADAAASRPR